MNAALMAAAFAVGILAGAAQLGPRLMRSALAKDDGTPAVAIPNGLAQLIVALLPVLLTLLGCPVPEVPTPNPPAPTPIVIPQATPPAPDVTDTGMLAPDQLRTVRYSETAAVHDAQLSWHVDPEPVAPDCSPCSQTETKTETKTAHHEPRNGPDPPEVVDRVEQPAVTVYRRQYVPLRQRLFQRRRL